MEKYSAPLEQVQENPKFLERFISFFRTRFGAAMSSATLPGSIGALVGSLAGPVGTAVGAVAVGGPLLIGGHDLGQGIENNIYKRPKKVLPPWREKLKNLASTVVFKVNQVVENGLMTGLVTGATAGIVTMNPAIGLGVGIAGAAAGGFGGWKFGNTLQKNIRNEESTVSSAYPAMMYASGQSVGFNRGV
jgi:uncharacterized membrane protein